MNTFGSLFRITTFGESHGPGIGVVIDGCPAGLAVAEEQIQAALDRRRPGPVGPDDAPLGGRPGGGAVGYFPGRNHRHAHQPLHPQPGPAQPRLLAHRARLPPLPRRLHLRPEVRPARLPGRGPQLGPRNGRPRGRRRRGPAAAQPARYSGGQLRFAGGRGGRAGGLRAAGSGPDRHQPRCAAPTPKRPSAWPTSSARPATGTTRWAAS